MLLENSLKKYKELPEAIKQIVGLAGLTATIIFTFIILNIFFGEIKESDKTAEIVKTVVIDKVITLLPRGRLRSEEHTSELQSRTNLVCRLLLEKKKRRAHV